MMDFFFDSVFFLHARVLVDIFGDVRYKTLHYGHPRIRMNAFWNRITENIDPELDPEAKNQESENFPPLENV